MLVEWTRHCLCFLHNFQQHADGFFAVHIGNMRADPIRWKVSLSSNKSSRLVPEATNIYCRINSPGVAQLTVELQFHVTGTFEFFKITSSICLPVSPVTVTRHNWVRPPFSILRAAQKIVGFCAHGVETVHHRSIPPEEAGSVNVFENEVLPRFRF